MLDGKAMLQNIWIIIASIFFAVMLFLLAPSGFRILKYKRKENPMEIEEYNFNQIASVIRNFCYALLIFFAVVVFFLMKASQPYLIYIQGVLGICSVVLPALCLRQTCYWLKMVSIDLHNGEVN